MTTKEREKIIEVGQQCACKTCLTGRCFNNCNKCSEKGKKKDCSSCYGAQK